MAPAQHIHGEEIQMPISINIRKIDPHGIKGSAPQDLAGNLREDAGSVIQPKPIFREKVIADIQVRIAIPVDIAKLRAKPEAFQRQLRRFGLRFEATA